jgi:hypothetical protein
VQSHYGFAEHGSQPSLSLEERSARSLESRVFGNFAREVPQTFFGKPIRRYPEFSETFALSTNVCRSFEREAVRAR